MKKNVLLPISVVLILALVSILPAVAEDEKPTADLSVSVLSAYIWRGQELSKDSAVVQPSMTVGYGGLQGLFSQYMGKPGYRSLFDHSRTRRPFQVERDRFNAFV